MMTSIFFSKTRNLNVKKMILITRLLDEIEKNYMHTERMYSELANQQSIQKQEINDITLKKLTKKHIGARICWLRNKLGRK